MSLADVTAEGVRAAIAEFDRLGRDPFLRSTGFSRSRAYYLEHGGQMYDSKAIVGYAHGVSTGTPLGPADFSGGDQTVALRLKGLGFTVHNLRSLGREMRSSWRARWLKPAAGSTWMRVIGELRSCPSFSKAR